VQTEFGSICIAATTEEFKDDEVGIVQPKLEEDFFFIHLKPASPQHPFKKGNLDKQIQLVMPLTNHHSEERALGCQLPTR
jgi:hypothetical protein